MKKWKISSYLKKSPVQKFKIMIKKIVFEVPRRKSEINIPWTCNLLKNSTQLQNSIIRLKNGTGKLLPSFKVTAYSPTSKEFRKLVSFVKRSTNFLIHLKITRSKYRPFSNDTACSSNTYLRDEKNSKNKRNHLESRWNIINSPVEMRKKGRTLFLLSSLVRKWKVKPSLKTNSIEKRDEFLKKRKKVYGEAVNFAYFFSSLHVQLVFVARGCPAFTGV